MQRDDSHADRGLIPMRTLLAAVAVSLLLWALIITIVTRLV